MGACSAADRGGGLAGSGPGRISANIPDPSQILARSQPDPGQNPTPSFKIDHFALLGKGMSTHVVVLLVAYLISNFTVNNFLWGRPDEKSRFP